MNKKSFKEFINEQEIIHQNFIKIATGVIPQSLIEQQKSIQHLVKPYQNKYIPYTIGQELNRLYENVNQPSIFSEIKRLHDNVNPSTIYYSNVSNSISSYINFENQKMNSLRNPILNFATNNQQLSALTTKLSQSFYILQNELKKSLNVPNKTLAYFKLSSLNWPIPMSFSLSKNFIDNISEMTDEEVNSYMINKLKKNDYCLLKKEMNMLINSLNDLDFKEHLAFKKQVKKIKDCFDYDTESIICFAPTLFSLLEYLNLNGKYFPRLKSSNIVNHHFFEKDRKSVV